MEVFASDVSKFASGVSSSYPITEYLPSFHINKYGAGVKGAKATSDIALNVDGVVKSTYLAFPTDTRSSNDNPTVASPIPGIRLDFKQNSTNGVYDGGSYNGVMTIRKYGIGTDWSGGPSSQLSFTDNGNMYIRTGTGTSWGSWAKIYSTRNKPTASEIGAAASSHTHNYINSKGFTPPQTGRTQNHGNVYSYNTSSGSSSTGAPTTYTSVMGFGSGTSGTIEIAGGWTSSGGLWYRQLRDVEDNWYAWKRVYTTDYKPTWSDIQSKPTVLTDGGTHSTVYLSNWFRSKGSSGWYNQDYGGGIYMNDSTWIKTYGSKNFLCDKILRGATIQSNLYEAANSTTNGTNMLEYSSSESMVRVSSTAAKTRFQANTWFHWNLNQGTGATENLEIYFENSSTSRAFRPAGADNNKIDLGSSSARFKKFWGYAYDYTSDSRHKFDIVSLSNKPTGLANNSKLKEAPQSRTDILKEEYDFFKNMPLYDYSLMNAEKNERTTGFLADELMEMNPGIASRFIRENEIDFSIDDDKPNLYCSDDEGEPPVEEEVKKVSTEKETRYSVSIESYIGNIHLVLQETMKKVDKLEEENRILKKRVGALEYDDLVVVG